MTRSRRTNGKEVVGRAEVRVLNKAWKNVDDKVFTSVKGTEIKRHEDRWHCPVQDPVLSWSNFTSH